MFLLFVGIIIIFLFGAFYSFGPGGRGGAAGRAKSESGRKVSNIVASVNRTNIGRIEFDHRYIMAAHNAPGGSLVTEARYLKSNLLDAMIEHILMQEAEKKEGVSVSGKEIEEKRQKLADEAIKSEFPETADLVHYLKKKQISAEEFRAKLIKDQFSDEKAIREQLMQEKLEKTIKDKVQPNEEQIKDSYTEVHARHILICPKDMKKKMQAEEAKAGKQQVQTQQDWDAMAKKKADDLLVQIKGGADFVKLADENTDDPSGKGKGGDLSWFKRGMMVPEFDQVAFALQPGQVSEVVKTQFGYHIMKVEDRRQKLPDDFDKEKAKYTTQVTEELKNQAWTQYRAALKKQAKIEIADSELNGYEKLKDGKEEEAAGFLAKAAQEDPQNMGARWELAQIYEHAGKKDEAMQMMAEITQSEQGAGAVQVRMAYAKLLQDAGKSTEAIEQYKAASDWASGLDFQNYFIHTQLKKTFEELKQTDLVTAEGKWMDDFQKQQKDNPGMGMGGMGMGGMGGGMPMPIQIPAGAEK